MNCGILAETFKYDGKFNLRKFDISSLLMGRFQCSYYMYILRQVARYKNNINFRQIKGMGLLNKIMDIGKPITSEE